MTDDEQYPMPVTLADMLKGVSSARREAIEREAQAIVKQSRTIGELRKALKVTQADLAMALETSQANVAQIEGKTDLMVSTLARIVEALGGRLDMIVTIPGREAVSLQIGDLTGVMRKRRTQAAPAAAASRAAIRKRA